VPKADTAAPSSPKVTRNSQVVLTAPPTVAAMVSLVQPALDRLTAGDAGVHLLVLVPDADTALAVAQAVLPSGDAAPVLIPVTSAGRGTRLMTRPPAALIGAPSDLAALLPSGLLKLDSVTQLYVLQADLTLALTDEASVTALMTELPKDIARTLTMAAETDDVTAFARAYMKRPRRVGDDVVADGSAPLNLQYVLVSNGARTAALRRVLDAVNAPSAIVVAPEAEQVAEAHAALRALGYDTLNGDVKATGGAVETHSVLRILYDVPSTRALLDAALGGHPVQSIALVTPRQVAHLRSLLTGGSLTCFVLPDTMAQAIGRDGARMGELRKILADGVSARELAALEPLLDDNDALEIAAAALRLLEREREMAKALRIGVTTAQPKEVKRAIAATAAQEAPVVPIESLAPEAPAAPASAPRRSDGPPPEFQILWFNIGNDDGATASSFVGAITGESGLDRSVVGSIDLHDSHTLVEVSGAHAEQIVAAMNASTMRNRQVIARIDRAGPMRSSSRGAPPRRSGGSSERSSGGFSRDRGERPARPSFRRDEGAAPRERSGYPRRDDGERPSRPPFARDDRPARAPRESGFPRDDRPARPPREGGFPRDERAARPPRSGGFSRDERPARAPREGGFSRDERPARPPRTGGFSRDERPARPSGGGFTRGPRDSGAPTSRGFTRDRSERADAPGTGGNDFAERAERLRNSRKPSRTED
jgi:ATP-dependent RNA helicase DeaD